MLDDAIAPVECGWIEVNSAFAESLVARGVAYGEGGWPWGARSLKPLHRATPWRPNTGRLRHPTFTTLTRSEDRERLPAP